jgi:nucleoid-associated protein YgaU
MVSQMRQYQAQPGDTVSRLAGRFLGANTRSNRQMIIDANPSLKDDPDRIVVGRTYLIPAAAESAPSANTAAPARPALARSTATGAQSTPAEASTYTAAEGDSLWSIARSQLGSGKYWQAIRDLNKDILHGTDKVQAGMVLRLPSRQVASAR